MKKLLLSISLLTSTLISAQDNWTPIEQGGFPTGVSFRLSQVFKNRIYVAGDFASTISLYSSPSGDAGSYVLENGLTPFLAGPNKNGLYSSVADANYMFLGSQTNYDTTGGATGVIPQVYRYDGTTYKKHGTINFAALPANNQLVSKSLNPPQIDGLVLYSPTGANDSIYAFVNTGDVNNMSVWKASASQTNPTWVNSVNFSAGSNITHITDAKVWHNKLYISTSTGANGGMILRTANGVDWDTVATGLGMSTVLGVNSFNTAFTALQVFRDTLVAAVQNSVNGIGLIYTADSLATMQNWNAFIDSTHSAGITMYWSDVSDMEVGNGKLWLQVNDMGNTRVYHVTKNAHNRDTLLTSTLSSGIEWSNDANYFRLSYFNSAIFSTGHTQDMSRNSSKGVQPTNYKLGVMWRFKTINPTASFVDSASGGFCQGKTANFTSTSLNASSYQWYINGLSYGGNSPFMSYTPNGGEVDVVSLVAYNGTTSSLYKDSTSKTVTFYWNPVIDTITVSLSTICQGQIDTVKAVVQPGSGPYLYMWQYALNVNSINDSIHPFTLTSVTSSSPAVIGFSVLDSNGCKTSAMYNLFVNVNQGDSLSGLIVDSMFSPVTTGKVYLFQKKLNHVGVADSAGVYDLDINADGKYTFPSLYYGDYYLKAVADTTNPSYATSVGTYYSTKPNAYQWDSAIVIQQHSCVGGNNSGRDIKIIQIPAAPSGPGTITGNISESFSFGQRTSNPNSVFGAPLKGIDIKLGKNPGGSAAARTSTDSAGNYSFHNVPVDKYKIYVDIPNYGMDSVRSVDLNLNNLSPHNDYYVDSAMVRVVPIDSVNSSICLGDSIKLAGVFQIAPGVYTDVKQSIWGYDSVVVTTLVVKSVPTLTATASNYTICAGTPTQLTVAGASTYLWSSNAGSAITSTVSVSPVANTAYTVTGTAANGCAVKKTISLMVNPLPTPTGLSNSPICINQTLHLNSAGGGTYTWSGPNTYTATTQNPSLTGATMAATGIYTVTVTDANNCNNSAMVNVVVNPLPVITASGSTVCVNGTVNLAASTAGGVNYSWVGPGSFSSSLQNPVLTNATTAMSGGYAVTVIDANNCVNTNVAQVTVNPFPNVTANASPDTVCAGSNLTLTGVGAATYTWTTGVVNGVPFSPSVTDTYTVVGIDANSCSNFAVVTVVVKTCIGINQYAAGTSLKVYPMPASNNLFVETEKDARIKICDIAGKVVLEQTLTAGKNAVSVTDLAAGAYNMIVNTNGQITNVKLMINK
jgi:hypothetical protein